MKGKSIASGLLALAAVLGVGVTVYFCSKETPEADEAVEEEKAKRKEEKEAKEETDNESDEDSTEKGEDQDINIDFGTIELLKIKAPKYKKTIIAGGITIVCIASGHLIQLAALSSALGGMYYWQNRYHGLDDVIKKAKGSEVYKEIHSMMAKEAKEKGEVKETKMSILEKLNHKSSFITVYEPESKQMIETTPERIERARNLLLSNFGNGKFVGVNAIIRILGGEPDTMLDNVGWTMDNEEQLEMVYYNGDSLVDLHIDVGRTDFNTKDDVLCVYYSTEPLPYDPTRQSWYHYGI